jgi:hypothetical protein
LYVQRIPCSGWWRHAAERFFGQAGNAVSNGQAMHTMTILLSLIILVQGKTKGMSVSSLHHTW